jgi:hypothetical protein
MSMLAMACKDHRESTENPDRGYAGIATSVKRYSSKVERSVDNVSTIDATIVLEYRRSATIPSLFQLTRCRAKKKRSSPPPLDNAEPV